ncbi:MAG: cupin domain-containing protein [Lysobacterales bacterium]
MAKIDLTKVPRKTGSGYPEPYASMMNKRSYMRLGDVGGLTQFGANITILEPGGLSSMRHWHVHEDEFVMVTQGEVVLINDDGETVMRAGDCAAFPAGVENGHHFLNRSDAEARFLVIGTRAPTETVYYSDVDMMVVDVDGVGTFTRKDGSPMPGAG